MNFGHDANIEHAFRYERAEGVPSTLRRRYRTVLGTNSLLLDKRSRFLRRIEARPPINYVGKHFRCEAP